MATATSIRLLSSIRLAIYRAATSLALLAKATPKGLAPACAPARRANG